MSVLDVLLKAEAKNITTDYPTEEIKQIRLSEICGEPVVFKIRALTYNKVAEIKETVSGEEMPVHIMLFGTLEPDLKSKELLAKYDAQTPAELVKKMLLPGEIDDISREIQRLSGYLVPTVEEIKKK